MGDPTKTTPASQNGEQNAILGINAAHKVSIAGTGYLAHPEDTLEKMQKALDRKGFRFLHILAPCPTGWKSEAAEGVELVRLAVDSGLFPIYEIEEGRRITINVEPAFTEGALERYFEAQGRFRKASFDYEQVKQAIRRNWDDLRARAAAWVG